MFDMIDRLFDNEIWKTGVFIGTMLLLFWLGRSYERDSREDDGNE